MGQTNTKKKEKKQIEEINKEIENLITRIEDLDLVRQNLAPVFEKEHEKEQIDKEIENLITQIEDLDLVRQNLAPVFEKEHEKEQIEDLMDLNEEIEDLLTGGARKPLTREQKDRRNERLRARRAALTQEEKDRKNAQERARYRARRARQQAASALVSLQQADLNEDLPGGSERENIQRLFGGNIYDLSPENENEPIPNPGNITTVRISTRIVPNEKFKDCVNLETVIFQPILNERMKALVDLIGMKNKLNYYENVKRQIVKFAEEYTEVIGDGAFWGCRSLTSITLPDSVATIGKAAFIRCSSLTSITLPDSLETIGDRAFYDCSSLTSIDLSSATLLETIGDGAFMWCGSLTSITLPDSVATIGNSAFEGCTSLTSITLPESSQLETIGNEAFLNVSANLYIHWCDRTFPLSPEVLEAILIQLGRGCDQVRASNACIII